MKTIGPYEVSQRLGSGGMGTVYQCLHTSDFHLAAVKVPLAHLQGDETALRRFEREAEAAQRVSHPHVARVIEANVENDPPYIALEYIDGQGLDVTLRGLDGRPMPVEQTLAILTPVGSALDACHAVGVVHRDVKPGNIMLAQRHAGVHPYLTDFGIVQLSGVTRLTMPAAPVGSATYISPEQANGERGTAASDVYSLACVAFECLTGRPPFQGANVVTVAAAHISAVPPAASSVNADLPRAFDPVLARALAKQPGARYASASAFVAALAAAAQPAAATQARTAPLPGLTRPDDVAWVRDEQAADAPERARVGAAAEDDRGAGRADADRPRRWTFPASAASVVVLLVASGYLLLGQEQGPPAATGTERVTTGSVAPPEPEQAVAAGVTLDSAQQDLLAAAPYSHLSDCRPNATRDRFQVALACQTDWPGVDDLLLYRSDPGPAVSDLVHGTTGRVPGRCSDSALATSTGVNSTWTKDKPWPVSCYVTADAAAIWWGYPETGLSMIATSAGKAQGYPALYDWWREQNWSRTPDVDPTPAP